jgi:hypothetical protein
LEKREFTGIKPLAVKITSPQVVWITLSLPSKEGSDEEFE